MFHRLVELPGYFIGMYCMDKLGRRISVCGSIVVGGFACLATGLLPEGTGFIFQIQDMMLLTAV